jgi:uncharacterized protein YcbX
VPKLATIQTHLNEQGLSLGVGKQFFVVPKTSAMLRQTPINIWGTTFQAAVEADLFSQAISHHLGISCRLVRYAAYSQRKVPSLHPEWKPEVRFADSLPVLLLNTRSLDELNGRLTLPVGIDRFRGNILFAGVAAFEEDAWTRIRVGEVIFSQPKKCSRCAMITIDQKTGELDGPEPLKTLASYRREDRKVNFGVLWIPENSGIIRLNDVLKVLS